MMPSALRNLRRALWWWGTRALPLALGAVVVGGVVALAWWTVGVLYASGSYALAGAATLSPPSAPTATALGSGAVMVGWTPSGSQLVGAQYRVTRTSGPGSPLTVCTVAPTVTTCQDTGLTAGTVYGYSIAAVLYSWDSSAVTVSATTATPTLEITLSPGPYTAGSTVTVVGVRALVGGVVDTTYTGAKTIAWGGLATSPSGASPTYPPSGVTFVGGVASPSSTLVAVAAGGNTLTATDSAATVVTGSVTFQVGFGSATRLWFTTSPGATPKGVAFVPTPVVAVQDTWGNTVTSGPPSTASITLAIGTNPAGGSLTCAGGATRAAVNGVVLFTGCSINNPGNGYTLTATATGLTPAVSATFNITNATKLAFTQQPGSSTGGTPLPSQPVVAVEDANGVVITSDSTTVVTLSISTNPGGGTLTCAGGTSRVAVSGFATFSGCAIDKAGNGYRLTATATSLTSATSTTFNITVGPAAKLAFSTSPPSTVTAGGTFTTAVTVQDLGGNTVTTDSSTVTIAIGANPGGGTLTCSAGLSKAAVNGVATFTGCWVDKAGAGYTLTAADGTLTGALSTPFTVVAAAATKLGFIQQPGSSTGGVALPTQPIVAVQDPWGNTVTTDSTSQVALDITVGTGNSNGTLTCSVDPLTVTNGIAVFSGCSIDAAGTGYTLTASDAATIPVLTSATSATFNITVGPAVQLGFLTPPSNGVAGTVWPAQPVAAVQDAGGNTVTTYTTTVTLAIGTNPGGGTLSCTGGLSRTTVGGLATWSGCSIDKAGTGYTLVASAVGLTPVTSGPFDIVVPGTVTATRITGVVDTKGGTKTTSTPSFTSVSGATYLVLIDRQSVNTGESASVTGPFTTSPILPFRTVQYPTNGKWYLFAFIATGSGATGPVTATFTANNNTTGIEVLQLIGNNTTNPIAQSTTGLLTNSNLVQATLSSPALYNGEVVWTGVAHDVNNISTTTGFTRVSFWHGHGNTYGGFVSSQAVASASFALPSRQTWGVIAIEINHG